jgi:hypothetical protein
VSEPVDEVEGVPTLGAGVRNAVAAMAKLMVMKAMRRNRKRFMSVLLEG